MEITIERLMPYLENLTEKQNGKLLYQLLKKDKVMIEKLYFKHISTPEVINSRYEEFKKKVIEVLFSNYRTYAEEQAPAKAINEAKKVIKSFTIIDKRPEKEAALHMIILETIFENSYQAQFGTCWTKYDWVVSQTLKRLITLVTKKLHEDYLLDYKPKLDQYLKRIKSVPDFNDFVYVLPDKL